MVERISYIEKYLHPFFVILGYLFLYLPIFILIIFSFNSASIPLSWHSFTLDWYRKMLATPELLAALKASLIVALSSTLLCSILATSLVIASFWWKPFFLFAPFFGSVILPDIVLALGLLVFCSFLWLPLGYSSLIIGHTLIGLGFAVPLLRARFAECDPTLIEASLDLGASNVYTIGRIIIPSLSSTLFAVALLVFTLSLDDFMVSFFCSGPQIQTISLYIYYQIKTHIDPSINAISTCLLIVSSLIVMFLAYFKLIDRAVLHD